MRGSRIQTRRIIAILACGLALYFAVAFGARALDAYRLRAWRDRLLVEIGEMERQRDALQHEVERREGLAWVDERLRDAGLAPPGVVSVIALPATPAPTPEPAVEPWATPEPEEAASEEGTALFSNPYWEAWMGAIRGFD